MLCRNWRGLTSKSRRLLFDEAVAHAPDGRDLVSEIAELLAKPQDVVVYRASEALVIAAPDAFDEELAVESSAWVGRKEVKQLEFLGSQRKLRAIQGCAVRVGLDAKRAVDDGFVRASAGLAASRLELHAAKGCARTREQLAYSERLHEAIVRADFQAEHPVALLGTGGEHDDRHQRVLPQLSADAHPVRPGP